MRTSLCFEFPDLQGKYREILRFRVGSYVQPMRNGSGHRCFFTEFPKIRNRELFSKSKEVSREIRELDCRIRVAPRDRFSAFAKPLLRVLQPHPPTRPKL